jgi:hypothetical protein
MPKRFEELGAYNERVAQGIAHTRAHRDRMAILQREFDDWHAEQIEAHKPIINAIKVTGGALTVMLFGQPAAKRQVELFMDGKMSADAAAAMRAQLMQGCLSASAGHAPDLPALRRKLSGPLRC